jgi:tetratricopeptide (TPR) repeat protein
MTYRSIKWLAVATVAVVLILSAGSAVAQTATQSPAERAAYAAALAVTQPAPRAKAFEDFVKQYPDSPAKADALVEAMTAYQDINDRIGAGDTARRILAFDDDNVRALGGLVDVDYAKMKEFTDDSIAERVRDEAEQGLASLVHWQRPDGMNEATFHTLHDRLSIAFDGALGAALVQTKDYAGARDHLRAALALAPDDFQNLYQLGQAELGVQPIDVNGFWYVARAAMLARTQQNAQASAMEAFGEEKYVAFHGGDDGWSDVLAAASQPNVPADFVKKVSAAPPPPALAVKMANTGDPSQLSFSDWAFILGFRDMTPANKQAADKVWQAIQGLQKNGQRLMIPVEVIGAYGDQLDGALTEANRKSNATDTHVTMREPMASPPDTGASVTVIGQIVGYQPQPFAFIVRNGELANNK